MKKINIILMGALAVGLYSCEEGPSTTPIQSNPQEPLIEASSLAGKAAGPIVSETVVNLSDYAKAGVQVYELESVEGLPEGSKPAFEFVISADEALAGSITVPCVVDGQVVKVDAFALNEAHAKLFGMGFDQHKVYYRLDSYVDAHNSLFGFGEAAKGSYEEVALCLLTPGAANGNDAAKSQGLAYTGKDDKPYFCGAVVIKDGFNVAVGDLSWGAAAASGKIVANGPAISVDAAGLYWVTVNIDDLTYDITPIESLGFVGGLNGWNVEDPILLAPNAGQSVWTADVALTGEWKIVGNKGWDINFGMPLDAMLYDGSNVSGYEGNYSAALDFTGVMPVLTLTAK